MQYIPAHEGISLTFLSWSDENIFEDVFAIYLPLFETERSDQRDCQDGLQQLSLFIPSLTQKIAYWVLTMCHVQTRKLLKLAVQKDSQWINIINKLSFIINS